MRPLRAKLTVAVLGVVLFGTVVVLVLSWKELTLRYHRFRIRRSPAYFAESLRQPGDALRFSAVKDALETGWGREELFELYFSSAVDAPPESPQRHALLSYLQAPEARTRLLRSFLEAVVTGIEGRQPGARVRGGATRLELTLVSRPRESLLLLIGPASRMSDSGQRHMELLRPGSPLHRYGPFLDVLETGRPEHPDYPDLRFTTIVSPQSVRCVVRSADAEEP